MSEQPSVVASDPIATVNMGAVVVPANQDPTKKVIIPKPFPAFFPSHDDRTMHNTINTVNLVATLLQRPIMTNFNHGLGQAVALNGMLAGFKQKCDQLTITEHMIEQRKMSEGKVRPVARGLWVEDDIELIGGQANEIARMILTADEHKWNVVAPYCTGFRNSGEFNWVYYKFPDEEKGEIGRPFTEQEIMDLKPFDRINGLAGLGFYYGDLFLDYAFYEGTYNGRDRFGLPSYSGIDWNYFLDNDIDLRHYPIVILHEKPVKFMNLRVIQYWGDGRMQPETDPDDYMVGVTTTHEEKARAEERKAKYVVS